MKEIKVNSQTSIRQVERYVWEVVQHGEMRVPGRIYTDQAGIDEIGLGSVNLTSGQGSTMRSHCSTRGSC